MDDLLTLKKKICEAIDENRDAFIALGHSVLREPETAFSEFKTAEKVRAALSGLGLQCQSGQAITGITADLHGRSDAAMIALMGELDAIILPDYPFADKTTGAAPAQPALACGGNQVGITFGPAIWQIPTHREARKVRTITGT